MNFKSLFLRNLHPGVSHHPGVMACPCSMTIQQLHDLIQKAYNKQKMASKKGNKTSTLLNSVNKDSSLALDDTQLYHNTRVLHQEHRENVTPMSTTVISPTAGKIHGTSHASQETQKIRTTGILTRHPKVIA